MRILYFSPHPHLNLASPSGYGTHMREMIEAFKEHGHDVKTFIAGGEQLNKNNLQFNFKEPLLKKIAKKITPKIIWESIKDLNIIRLDKKVSDKLNHLIKDYQPDLIYERGCYLMPSGALIARQNNIRHILEINAPYIEERIEFQGNTLIKEKALSAERQQIEATQRLVVVSSALKEYFANKYPKAANKIIVTPNAINLSKVKINTERVEMLRKESHLENKTVIGFVGSILPYHGIDKLLLAFSKIKVQRPSAKLLIVGDGETLPELKSMAAALNLKEDVLFTGNVKHEEIFNYISLFDIAVLAKTNWYCSPIKIFEYGVAGKAIVSMDTPSVRDVMTPDEDGILVDETESALIKALLTYIDQPALRKKQAESFQEKVKTRHTWNKMAEKVFTYNN